MRKFLIRHWPGIILALLSLIGRLIYNYSTYNYETHYKWMPKELDEIAIGFVDGSTYTNPTGWGSYPALLGQFYRFVDLFGQIDNRMYWLIGLNAILGGIAVLLFYFLVRKLLKERWLVWGTSIAFAVYYPLIYLGSINVSENLFVVVILAIVLQTTNEKPLGVLDGILFGLAIVLRPLVLPFAAAYFLWLIWTRRLKLDIFGGKYMLELITFGGAILMIVSYLNAEVDAHNRYSFNGNGGVNMALTWCQPRRIRYELESGESFWFSPPEFHDKDKSTDINTNVPFYEQGYYYQLALNCIKEHPERLITNLTHIINIWDSRLYPDFKPIPEVHQLLIDFWKIATLPLLIGMIIWPYHRKKETLLREQWVLATLLLLSLATSVYLANPGEERYLYPYFFVILIWGVAGWYELIKRIAKMKK